MTPNRRSVPASDSGEDGHRLARGQAALETDHGQCLPPAEPQRRGRLAGLELERQDAHPDEVGAMDPLEALGDDEADAQQGRALGRPVA